MTDIKKVKVSHIIESQIPEFLNQESPLFEEFLKQYYISQEHQSGVTDIATNLTDYRQIGAFNYETLVPGTLLTKKVLAGSGTINVASTTGWPDTYGLLKIDNEIITYKTKTATQFLGCSRGFSGIDQISKEDDAEFLNFAITDADTHALGTTVYNLSNLFLQSFFTRYKEEFLPGFENRTFTTGTSITNVLTRAKDFYMSKGTDASYQILFKLLYGKEIELIKPIDQTISPSSNVYFQTKHILVENLFGGTPLDSVGNFLYQDIAGIGTVSASIYNVEYRPIANKDFYEISLDSTSFDGSFQIPGKTKTLEATSQNSTSLVVDSTVGFGKTGSLLIKPSAESNFLSVSYTDKTVNQFLGVTGISTDMSFAADIFENKLAYAYAGFGQTSLLQFRLVNVIDSVDTTDTSNMMIGDSMKLHSFGSDLSDSPKFNNWIYNIPSTHDIFRFSQVNVNTYRINLFDAVTFYIDEELIISDQYNNTSTVTIKDIEYGATNIQKKFSDTIVVQAATIPPNTPVKIQKKVIKASHNSNYFTGVDQYPVGIQNSYLDSDEKSFYVTSSGLPNYPVFATDNKVWVKSSDVQVTDGTGTPILGGGYTYTIKSIDPASNALLKHNYVTGDKIFWDNTTYSGIQTGIYFVTSVNQTEFLLSYSGSDVFAKKYVAVKTNTTGQYIYKSGWENKTLKNQKILRKFDYVKEKNYFDDPNKRKIDNRAIGLMANGVELFPPTVLDEQIFFGDIQGIEVTNSGKNYDVITGPPLIINDSAGTGAVGYANVVGSFKEVKLVTPGIGYQEKPKISVTGGNGTGAVLESNFVRGRIIANFKADGTSVNTSSDTIDFEDRHNFELGEGVIYDSRTNPNVGNIVSGSTYFVNPVSDKIVKLHLTPEDAVAGINTINIGSVSYGFHRLTTTASKNTITKVYVKEPGSGYSNKKIIVPGRPVNGDTQSGISTSDDYIFAPNHNFQSGEIVQYRTTGTVVNGLTTTTEYKVGKIDSNRFKLYDIGIGTQKTPENYDKRRTQTLRGVGTGKHTIEYPPIVVSIEALSGIGATTIIEPVLSPKVLGSIESVYLEDGGIGYGCTNILDFHRRPDVGISTVVFQSLLKPIIIDGSIVDVQILAAGSGYREDSDIVVYSPKGSFADIQPIIANNKITGVKILDGGVGYGSSDTTLTLQNRGVSAKFIADVREWKINQVDKNEDIISREDSILIKPSNNPEFQLQTISMYPPQKLRYQLGDNLDPGNLELSANAVHSPILGYAYDGNPIYGPYGYQTPTGGSVVRLKSGYILDNTSKVGLRPPGYSLGSFINDYLFDNSGDLDEYGGRYCITPQFPDGTYAYFYSIDVDSSGVAEPKYPYIMGTRFKDLPIEENFITFFNQDSDLIAKQFTRNIGPYYLSYGNSDYDLIDKVDDNYKQSFDVTKTKTSGISSVTIFARGTGYRVNDSLKLDNSGTDGTGTNIVVSEVLGEEVNSLQIGVTTFVSTDLMLENNKIVAISTIPHEIANGEVVYLSGISTSQFTPFNGQQKVEVLTRAVGLSTNLANVSSTGITTYIDVTDTRGFNVSDVIGIGTETMTVLEVDTKFSRLRVNREYYVGIAVTHAAGTDNIVLKPTKFSFDLGNQNVSYLSFQNYTKFFNPTETVGVGSTGTHYKIVSTGLATALTETIENRFVEERSLYLPGHTYFTGQKLIYNVGVGGSSLVWSPTGAGSTSGIGTEWFGDERELYAVNLGKDRLGLSTVGFPSASDAVWFYNLSSVVGIAHSLRTTFPRVNSTVERFFGRVVTKTNHNLQSNDVITLDAIPTETEEVVLRYDPVLAKITTEKVSFTQAEVTADLTAIAITNDTFQNGDKVVYYANGNTIAGLVDNETYFILREDPVNIKLCKHKSDVKDAKIVTITSVATGTYYLARINPALNFTTGNLISFDVSDTTLQDMRLDFFEDIDFVSRLDVDGDSELGFNITRSGTPGTAAATVTIRSNTDYPRKSYYSLTPVVPSDTRKLYNISDKEVIGRNNITFNEIVIRKQHTILRAGDKEFTFNLKDRPTSPQMLVSRAGVSTITYRTDSLTAKGPIAKTKINFPGKGYRILPRVVGFGSSEGKDGVVKVYSTDIGEVDNLDRVKDGFDYPTDPTLLPFLSVPAIADINGIARIDTIDVLDGGRNYTQPPTVTVRGNKNVKIASHVAGGAVDSVEVVQNAFEFNEPLSIITTKNSNGYDIDAISHSGTDVTIELLLDPQFNKPITSGFASTDITFPFKIGDMVFVEGCRIKPASQSAGEFNFNSEVFDYNFFPVTGINSTNYTVTYSMADVAGISTVTLGSYDDDFTLGYIVNYNDMAKFDMKLIDDGKYLSGERVTSTKFEGYVAENGWDPRLNQLRLRDTTGILRSGDTLIGEVSELEGNVRDVNRFTVSTKLGVTRNKVSKNDMNFGILNDFSQRISDNFYYQKFSYSIKSDLPYDKWKESVRSILHPSGFLEFSDLKIESDSKKDVDALDLVTVGIAKSNNMKVKAVDTKVDLLINIDNDIFMGNKQNFCMVTEDDMHPDGSVQRIFFPEGRPIKSYILNKTNKVLKIDDISGGFDGKHDRTGTLVGNTKFRLTSGTQSIFKQSFDSSDSSAVNLTNNSIKIIGHNFQSGQELIYDKQGGDGVGIATTSHIAGTKDIVMSVAHSGYGGSAMYENGYNNQIPGPVTGVSTTANPIVVYKIFGFGSPDGGLPGISTRGTEARFQVKIDYNQSTGQPISTAVTLIKGGGGYFVGDNVSIAGTYLGGATAANNLTFPVTAVTGTRVGILTTYSNVPSTNDGAGTGARFNVWRDTNLDISQVDVVAGGSGYATTNTISIAGTYIGGATPADNISVTPIELGGTAIPERVFIQKIDDTTFRLSGLSTGLPLDFVGLGTGTHILKYAEPNLNALIMIDNIIQTPIKNKKLSVGIGSQISKIDQGIIISSGIGSLTQGDIIKVDEELIKVKSIGDTTFVKTRYANAETTVDNNFYYDTKRMNSSVVRMGSTLATHDDNPPY